MTTEKKIRKQDNTEFIEGYNAAIQNLSFAVVRDSYDFLAEALVSSGFDREDFIKAQSESGWQQEEMEEIIDMAFPPKKAKKANS
jgi:hypothetical protein